jgi:hypothetical protein
MACPRPKIEGLGTGNLSVASRDFHEERRGRPRRGYGDDEGRRIFLEV